MANKNETICPGIAQVAIGAYANPTIVGNNANADGTIAQGTWGFRVNGADLEIVRYESSEWIVKQTINA